MENIIFKKLVGIKLNNEWFYNGNGEPTTVESIINIINNTYISFDVITIHQTENEIYVITKKPII